MGQEAFMIDADGGEESYSMVEDSPSEALPCCWRCLGKRFFSWAHSCRYGRAVRRLEGYCPRARFCPHFVILVVLLVLSLGAIAHTLLSVVPAPDREPSLFCFSLMLSDSYEVFLLQEQFKRQVGPFLCDGHAVFSDAPVILGGSPPVLAEVVDGDLHVPMDPVYNFGLSAPVFLHIWSLILARGDFRRHDWTMKLDPDAVFLPSRLRQRLRLHGPSPRERVFLVNCRLGLRGPLEVLSAPAVEALGSGMRRCREERPQGLDTEGEDMFLAACLDLLGVRREEAFWLLSDVTCEEQPFPCTSGKVAFHPMKQVERYVQCLAQAEG